METNDPHKWHQKIKSVLNTNKTELDMHIPGVDRVNKKDTANAMNLKFVGVSSHIDPLDTFKLPAFLPALKQLLRYTPWKCMKSLGRLKSLNLVDLIVFPLNS